MDETLFCVEYYFMKGNSHIQLEQFIKGLNIFRAVIKTQVTQNVLGAVFLEVGSPETMGKIHDMVIQKAKFASSCKSTYRH